MITSLGILAGADPSATAMEAKRDNARRSAHFRVTSAAGPLPDRLERETLRAMEDTYQRFLVLFETEPPTPIEIRFHPSELFHRQTGAPPWADGMFERDGFIRVAAGGVTRLEARLEVVLAHELAHAFITTRSRGRAPRWLQEGLAQSLAGGPPPARFAPPGDRPDELDYAGCQVFTEMLRVYLGTEGLVDILRALGDGVSIDEAFAAESGSNLSDMYREWRQHLADRRQHGDDGAQE